MDYSIIENRLKKLTMLGTEYRVYFDRFAIIQHLDKAELMDLYTNITYPGYVINIDHNDGGIFIVQLSEDGINTVGSLKSVVFISTNSTWLMSEEPSSFLPFELVGNPIILNGRTTIYNYYRDKFIQNYSVDTKSKIAMLCSTIKDSTYQHKVFHFLDLTTGQIIQSVHSRGVENIKSISLNRLWVNFFSILNPDTGFDKISNGVAYSISTITE